MRVLLIVIIVLGSWISAFGQQNDFVIADAEKTFLYLEYPNILTFASNRKMDTLWVVCDSAIIEYRDKNMVNFTLTIKKKGFVEVILMGKRRKKTYVLSRQRFLVTNIPPPFLYIYQNRVDGNFNALDDSTAFGNERMFLKIDPTVIVNATNTIERVYISIGVQQFTSINGQLSENFLSAFWKAEKGTKIVFDYYIYSGDGGHNHERVNMNIVYEKKGDSQAYLQKN